MSTKDKLLEFRTQAKNRVYLRQLKRRLYKMVKRYQKLTPYIHWTLEPGEKPGGGGRVFYLTGRWVNYGGPMEVSMWFTAGAVMKLKNNYERDSLLVNIAMSVAAEQQMIWRPSDKGDAELRDLMIALTNEDLEQYEQD